VADRLILPRLFSAPLVTGPPGPCGCGCALQEGDTYGFQVERFARDVLGQPLDAWQRWLVIHAGELLPDGRPRFRKLLIIVARQNGKTHLLKVLTLFWLYAERWPVILGQSTTLGMAKEVWESAYAMALANPWMEPLKGDILKGNNNPHWTTAVGSRYNIAAANSKGGRGGSVDRLIVDELREHKTWVAYRAAVPTINARPYGQAWMISNQGDADSVVLDSLRKRAIRQMALLIGEQNVREIERELRDALLDAKRGTELDDMDDEIALFEWSAPPGARPDDPRALLMANPNAGDLRDGARVSLKSLIGDARSAMEAGGDELAGFRTEILCQRVDQLDAAIDPDAWADSLNPGTLEGLRSRLALVFDVAPDQQHVAALVAAVQPNGKVRVEAVGSWPTVAAARAELPGLIREIRPRKVGWFPYGPAASMAAMFSEDSWRPPAGTVVEAIRGDVPAACMGLADIIKAGELEHSASVPGQELLDAQVPAAAKLWRGEGVWIFSRTGGGHCDAVYAMAGAAHLARTMPQGIGKPRLVVAGSGK
jgi:hypothetical protein